MARDALCIQGARKGDGLVASGQPAERGVATPEDDSLWCGFGPNCIIPAKLPKLSQEEEEAWREEWDLLADSQLYYSPIAGPCAGWCRLRTTGVSRNAMVRLHMAFAEGVSQAVRRTLYPHVTTVWELTKEGC